MDVDILSLDCGETEEERAWSRFLAIGCADKTVKILSLDDDSSCLERISV